MCLGVGPLCTAATCRGGKLDNKLRLPFGLGLVVQFEVCLRIAGRDSRRTGRHADRIDHRWLGRLAISPLPACGPAGLERARRRVWTWLPFVIATAIVGVTAWANAFWGTRACPRLEQQDAPDAGAMAAEPAVVAEGVLGIG